MIQETCTQGFIDLIQEKGLMMILEGSKHVAILTKLNKVDVFDANLICYNIINTSGCLISNIIVL